MAVAKKTAPAVSATIKHNKNHATLESFDFQKGKAILKKAFIDSLSGNESLPCKALSYSGDACFSPTLNKGILNMCFPKFS